MDAEISKAREISAQDIQGALAFKTFNSTTEESAVKANPMVQNTLHMFSSGGEQDVIMGGDMGNKNNSTSTKQKQMESEEAKR